MWNYTHKSVYPESFYLEIFYPRTDLSIPTKVSTFSKRFYLRLNTFSIGLKRIYFGPSLAYIFWFLLLQEEEPADFYTMPNPLNPKPKIACRAKYQYTKQKEDELTFPKGALIVNIKKYGGGWWQVTLLLFTSRSLKGLSSSTSRSTVEAGGR